jgi:hypothetical protein
LSYNARMPESPGTSPCRGRGCPPDSLSLRGAKRRSNLGVVGREHTNERLPRLLLAGRGEWLAMTGRGGAEDQRGWKRMPDRTVGFASLYLPYGLPETRATTGRLPLQEVQQYAAGSWGCLRGGEFSPEVCRGMKPLCRGFGSVPQFPVSPPKIVDPPQEE